MNRIISRLPLVLLVSLTLLVAACGDDKKKEDNDMDAVDGDMATDLFPDGDNDMPDMADTDMDTEEDGDMVIPNERIVCETQLPTPSNGLCEVVAGGGSISIQGTVLSGNTIYENGTVVLDESSPNRRITCVGCDCDTTGTTVVACPDGVVSPGLINGHDHLTFDIGEPIAHTEDYDNRQDWRCGVRDHTELDTPSSDNSQEAILYAELRMLFGGATSIAGSVEGSESESNARGLLRNVDAPGANGDLAGVDTEYETFPLGDSTRSPQQCEANLIAEGCDYPRVFFESRARGADIFLPHISEGIDAEARNEFVCLAGASGEDTINSNTSIIHGVGLLAEDVQMMADEGAKLVWSPRTNVDLYGNTAQAPLFRNTGVTIALGTDWSSSGSMNMLRELQCVDYLNRNHYDGVFSDYEMWLMATWNGAIAMGAEDQLGLLREGYVGDIAIFDGSESTDYRAVIDAQPQDVALVLRGGEPLYGDTSVIDGLLGPAAQACDDVQADDTGGDVCGVPKKVCVQSDAGISLSAIKNAVGNTYGLIYCMDPPSEPSCVPDRNGEYTGMSMADDADGDGVDNSSDNCPNIFNPIRPVDGNAQADADQDGMGDVCDPCPVDGNNSCPAPTPGDLDGDGALDFDDNCINTPNEDQVDQDGDGIGDACDACPAQPNPGGTACVASIYDIKQGVVSVGSSVALDNVVVTAANDGYGVFVQVHPDDADYDTPEFSGVFVYLPGADPLPQPGDRIDVEGTVQDFFGQIQVADVTNVAINSSGNPLPPITTVNPADVSTTGAMRENYEAVLVRVENVTVLELNPPAGPGDSDPTNEFVVTGNLRVNDLLYLADPFPAVDDTYEALSGVLRWANDDSKLEPRGPADFGPPGLLPFENSFVFLEEGTTGPTSPPLAARLSAPAESDVTVALSYAPAGVVDGPMSVVIPTGSTSVPLMLTGTSANTMPATVTAAYDGVMEPAQVRVYNDADTRLVQSLTPTMVTVSTGASAMMTVTLDIPAGSMGQVVDLTYTGEATGPATVTVLAGDRTANFTINATMSVGPGTVTADIGGSMQTANVDVVDAPTTSDLVIVEVFYDSSGSDDGREWIKLYNGTGSSIDLSGYSLGWGGTDYTWGQVDLTGSVPPAGCFLVGGPDSDMANGSPVYDQAENLEQDLQNSNSAGVADGVALFDVSSAQVMAGTVPIDAVLYGTTNDSNLIDETGMAAPVDVMDAPADSSIRLNFTNGGVWEVNATPTPNDCPPL